MKNPEVQDREDFGRRFAQERRHKAARDQREIQQKEIADFVGVSESTVSRWESGGAIPRGGALRRLSDFFGVTPAWMRYGDMAARHPVLRETPAEKPAIGPSAGHTATTKRASGTTGRRGK